MKKLHNAFTMVELVAVIVIFGIVAAIGSEIFVKLYENYMLTRSMNSLQTKTELALEQIAKRLQYRIKYASIARKTSPLTDYVSLADPYLNDDYKILEWIGYDNEGLKGTYNSSEHYHTPGWSGFLDVNDSNKTLLLTPGSDLDKENTIISVLSHGNLDLNSSGGIVFNGSLGAFDVTKYGWTPATTWNADNVYEINEYNATAFSVVDATLPDEIFERYKLVWTAYAIVPQTDSNAFCTEADVNQSKCNLYLYMNYRPWKHEAYNGNNSSKFLLIEHVSTFKFKQNGDILRLKLCVNERLVETNVSICKEKAVF